MCNEAHSQPPGCIHWDCIMDKPQRAMNPPADKASVILCLVQTQSQGAPQGGQLHPFHTSWPPSSRVCQVKSHPDRSCRSEHASSILAGALYRLRLRLQICLTPACSVDPLVQPHCIQQKDIIQPFGLFA